ESCTTCDDLLEAERIIQNLPPLEDSKLEETKKRVERLEKCLENASQSIDNDKQFFKELKALLPETFYADRNLKERMSFLVSEWRALYEANQKLESNALFMMKKKQALHGYLVQLITLINKEEELRD